ncbi:Gfo/Idh/MocA family oxidoreductase [Allokutzneria multivorans]|uniref:Gfo/Idh/MocA family oxidoreductase n=1 Tax=Allokutzneria multivorans TaxID=1142134 RepID=A0ABP7RWT5_9PSEU
MPGKALRVGMVGYAFMGVAHSQGWRNARSFHNPLIEPELAVVCGRDTAKAGELARRFGWGEVVGDWRELVAREDIDLIDICTPGDTHAEIAIAALDAGKHVLCEKPLANTVAEAEAMAEAAERALSRGVYATVGFTYRRVPAIALAAKWLWEGRVGCVRHVRAQYLQDWLTDADAPLSWRLRKEKAGSGALGDIGAHIIDLVQHLTGESVTGVSAMTETFVRQRPLASGDGFGEVTVDDAAVFLGRLSGGALATFEATRFATGRKNAIRLEINGTEGGLAFDFEDMNVLWWHDATAEPAEAGYRRIVVTEPEHPYLAGWWPPGHGLGYEHAFTHQALDLLDAIAQARQPAPSFTEGLGVQRVLDAVQVSAADESRWTPIPGSRVGAS